MTNIYRYHIIKFIYSIWYQYYWKVQQHEKVFILSAAVMWLNDKSRQSVRAKGGRKIRETDQSCQASENEYCLGVYSIGGTSCLKHEASFARFCWVLSWGDVTATWNSRLLNPPVLDAWGYDVQMVSSYKKSSHCDSRPQIQDSSFKFSDYPAPSLNQSCYPLSHTHSTRIVSSTTYNFVSTELLPK